MNKYNDYLRKLLTIFPTYKLAIDDEKKIEKEGLSKWISAKLVANKFRKATLSDITRQDIYQKVTSSVIKKEPIYLIICFGGYKHYWNISHPKVDWAEFFNLRFMMEYISPLLAVYEPGVIIEYEAEDYLLPLMNNYPEKSIELYTESFKNLLKIIEKYLPSNLLIRYVRAKDQYDVNLLKAKLDQVMEKKKDHLESLPIAVKEKILLKTENNIMWEGKIDHTNLSKEEKKAIIIKSRCMNEAFLEIDYEIRKHYFIGNNHISIVLSWGMSSDNIEHWLTLGSTYSSSVDFWIGRGVLEEYNNKFVPRIVSHTQYENIQQYLNKIEVNIFSLVNFNNIEIYKGKLVF